MSNAFQKVYDQINQTNLINQRLMEAELIFGGLQGFDCAHCYFTRLNLKKWGPSNFAFNPVWHGTGPFYLNQGRHMW